MSLVSTITAALMAIAATRINVSAFATPAFQLTTHQHKFSIQSKSCLAATRERSRPARRGRNNNDSFDNNAFGDFEDDGYYEGHDDFEDDFDEAYNPQKKTSRQSTNNNKQNFNNNNRPSAASSSTQQQASSSTFYSQKSLSDPSFSITTKQNKQFFQQLCNSANIGQPSRIHALAWPPLLRNENCIVADQTGSGKTLAYLLPLLQKLHASDQVESTKGEGGNTARKKKRTGSPRIVILTPTAELADQIHSVCARLTKHLGSTPGSDGWTFNPFVTTATGSHSTNIRDQIRLLQSTPVDVLISTPGRISTILRTKNAGLDLGHVQSLVLDEVDFLLVDETFGPQLRTVGVAVQGGGSGDGSEDNNDSGPQFIFVTATLPDDVKQSIESEFPKVTSIKGPGLHRITPAVHQTLVDVSVPTDSIKDSKACFDIKIREMLKALRGRRCSKTLIFCNTVETCRDVENVLRRKDRKGRRNRVWAYHNALSADVRVKNLRAFSGNDGYEEDETTEQILVCTDRAARGIDFNQSPIDHVMLFDFPRDPAEYVRRVGRTARAGRAGASTVLAFGWQLPIARQIMGLSDGGGGKGKKGGGKKGNAKLESFNMMKSSDGWDEQDRLDAEYMKGGAKRRKEMAAGAKGPGGSTGKKKPKKNAKDKGKPWK